MNKSSTSDRPTLSSAIFEIADELNISNWNRVISAIPDIFEMLKMAVEEDSK